ncbi:hypothetical protein LCGC14_0146370 [marine sediment metagenome]|uniref:Uncharacterized protein n=1 Tax=marine sediment metagenome TaxID=412755 RepID=A0A0F9XHJ1_9ZZZZ
MSKLQSNRFPNSRLKEKIGALEGEFVDLLLYSFGSGYQEAKGAELKIINNALQRLRVITDSLFPIEEALTPDEVDRVIEEFAKENM